MILPKASSTLDKIASSQALFLIWCTTAGGSLPPIGFCPTGNTPLPPLQALNRRARNALAHTPPIPEPFTHRTHSPLNSPTAPPLDNTYNALAQPHPFPAQFANSTAARLSLLFISLFLS